MNNNFNKNNRENLDKPIDIYGKQEIMELFHCESDKALRILKIMFQLKEANKIGKEYYVEKESLLNFLERYKGEELYI